jgi:hypothetical protein
LKQLISQLGSRPGRAPETLVHFFVEMLFEDVARDARALRQNRPEETPAQLGAEVVERAARRAAIQGAIAGTPLYLVLVPAYMAVLLEQARMVLMIAALNGAGTDRVEAAAELLTLSLVYPDVAQARREVEISLAEPEPPPRLRGRGWLNVGRALLILSGFITPRELTSAEGRIKTAAFSVLGLVAFVLTFIFSLFSIVALAWASQATTDTLGCRARRYYGDPDATSTVHPWRRLLWQALILITAVGPILLLVLGANPHHPHGLKLTRVCGFFVALALVISALRRLLPTGKRAGGD